MGSPRSPLILPPSALAVLDLAPCFEPASGCNAGHRCQRCPRPRPALPLARVGSDFFRGVAKSALHRVPARPQRLIPRDLQRQFSVDQIHHRLPGGFAAPPARFNTRQFMIHHRLKSGEWQDARPQESPGLNGIMCTIDSSPGHFMGAALVSAAPESAAVFDEHYFTSLMMVPYCKQLSRHLISHLDYPSGVSGKFLEEYRKTIAKFASD